MKANSLSKDRISSLPDNIIETILCLVPIRDAVRTSILSKKWRYSWNQIPRLAFNEKDMFDDFTVEDHEQDEDEEEKEDEDEVEEEEEEEDEDEVDEEENEVEEEEEEEKNSVEEGEEDDSEEEDTMMMWKREDKERKELIRKCKHFEAIHRKSKRFNAIHQVLLMHNGVISEFTLSVNLDDNCDEIDTIITYL